MNEEKSLTKDIINNSKLITSDAEALLKHFGKEPDVAVKPTPRTSKAKKTSERKIVYEEPKEESKKESKKQEEEKVELNPNMKLSMLSLEEFLELVPYYKDLMKVIDYKGPKWWIDELEYNVCPEYGIHGYSQFINTSVKQFIEARDKVEKASKEEPKQEEPKKEQPKKEQPKKEQPKKEQPKKQQIEPPKTFSEIDDGYEANMIKEIMEEVEEDERQSIKKKEATKVKRQFKQKQRNRKRAEEARAKDEENHKRMIEKLERMRKN